MKKSKIEWTETTWNPITGCTKFTAGCENCYAERMARRLQAMGAPGYENGFEISIHRDRFFDPIRWKKSRMVFVCSMGDLFHKAVSEEVVNQLFEVMEQSPAHTFQVLTKRAVRLLEVRRWPKNVWAGVTVENNVTTARIHCLRASGAKVKFLSCEPLLSALPGLDLNGIDWVIVGGESGPCARPMDPEWVRGIRDQCIASNVPFFFKQWGGVHKKENGCLLDGVEWKQFPRLKVTP